ncbi:MAG: hypothetical protein HQM11_04930 [SAR324 cluster bacterium]|nr:hypothetical protein [SAR324 cluster bacterium]
MTEYSPDQYEQLEGRIKQIEQESRKKRWFHLPSTILGIVICTVFLSILGYANTPSSVSRTDFTAGSVISSSNINSQFNTIYSAVNELLTKIQIVGSSINVTGNPAITGNTAIMGNLSATGVVTLSDTTQSTSKDTGSVIMEGGLGVEKDIFAGGVISGKPRYLVKAVLTNNFSVTSSLTKIPFNKVDGYGFESGGSYWDIANSRFVAPFDGYYQVSALITQGLPTGTSGNSWFLQVRQNVSADLVIYAATPANVTGNYLTLSANSILKLVKDDYLEFHTYLASGTLSTLSANNSFQSVTVEYLGAY